MKKAKIPVFNQKFDIRTFFTIVRKSFWIVVLISIISLISGFLYYRYTIPTYETSTILQIKNENKTNKILDIDDGLSQSDLTGLIELIQSKTFLKQCFDELPLEISYFRKGTFISTEIYRQSPFTVSFKMNNSSIYNKKIEILFINGKYQLRYKIGNNEYEYVLAPEEWHPIYGGEIFIHYNSPKAIRVDQQSDGTAKYLFTINSPASVYQSISKNLIVRIHNESARTIIIMFKGHNALKIYEITNTIAERFIEYDLEKKSQSATNIISYIDQQLEVVFLELDKNERDLHDFRKENRILPTDGGMGYSKFPLFTSKISDLDDKIINIEFEIITLQQVQSEIEQNPNLNIYELMALLYSSESQKFINNMLSSLQGLMNQRELLLFDITTNNFKIQTLDEQIENKKNMIIDFIDSAIERLEQQKVDYKSKIAQFESELFVDSTYKEIELAKLNRLYSINESFYYQLVRTKAEYMISQAGFVSNNIILEKATLPKSQKSPVLVSIMLMFIIVSIFLSGIIIILRYLLYNKISSVEDINTYSDIPVIGGVPTSTIKSEVSQLIVHNRPKSMLAESFRNIRSNMEFVTSENKSKIISISSTISGEGKTFIALNLGAILAMAGNKVIMLDFDLRKPRFHKSFDVDNLKGISTILINRHTIDECTGKLDVEDLFYITSGPIPPNPGEIIMTQAYDDLLEELRKRYDFIIIDTPPIGIVTDAMTSFQKADYPIYVTRSGVSPKAFIEHINDFAETSKIKNLSIILNGIEGGSSNYGYGYKYGYGYRYGYSKYGYGYGYGYTEHMSSNNYYSNEPKAKRNLIQILKKLFKNK